VGEAFSHTLRARYAECDIQGVVFNAHYLAYFDISMTELWRAAFGGYNEMLARGLDMVVGEARLRFRGAARFDDELQVSVAITELGKTSIHSLHRISRNNELLVEGEMRHVLVDRETLEKTSIPDWAREGLGPWVVPRVS
jgi:acyl-CoA thioester hydrolase